MLCAVLVSGRTHSLSAWLKQYVKNGGRLKNSLWYSFSDHKLF